MGLPPLGVRWHADNNRARLSTVTAIVRVALTASNGTQTANTLLLGPYVAECFYMVNDGIGSTLVARFRD